MWKACLAACLTLFSFPGMAMAHFGMVIPSHAVVAEKSDAGITLELSFSHPMEMAGMPLARPKAFQVFADGMVEDIGTSLRAASVMAQDAWKARYTVKKPGVYQFAMEPQPYWEPAEDRFILHYVKTYVAAFGAEDGWDTPVGLKTEIVPLTRPFGNYAGNVFQGQVLLGGKPVPHAAVEVEYYNKGLQYAAPNESMVTQAIKADANGVFTYGVPFAGWWGFAALHAADETMKHDGEDKEVELGAVVWVEFVSPVAKKPSR